MNNEAPSMAELRQISKDLASMPTDTARVLAQRRREELIARLIPGGYPEDMVHSAAEVASGDRAVVDALIPTVAHDLAVDMAAWLAAEAPPGPLSCAWDRAASCSAVTVAVGCMDDLDIAHVPYPNR